MKENSLNEAEEAVYIDAANELLSDGTTKLANSTASSSAVHVDRKGVKVAFVMIETAKANLEKAKTKLASVMDKQGMFSFKKQTTY